MRIPYVLAVVSGILLALSFPKFGHPAFAWVALAPLLVALGMRHGIAENCRPSLRTAFLLGLTTGGVYFGGTVYWVANVMTMYGDLKMPVAIAIAALLIAYLALFPAFFAVIVGRLVIGFGVEALLLSPLVWVATELGRTHIMSGFPWVLLGYSQVTMLPVAQLASVFGVFGVSGLVASVSAVAALSALSPDRRKVVSAALTVALLLLVTAVWGAWRVGRSDLTRQGDPIRVALVQGDVNQEEKWSAVRSAYILNQYLAMTRQAIAARAQFILWPESSTPFYFDQDRLAADQVRALAREGRASILLGSDQIEQGSPTKYYNSAYWSVLTDRPGGSTARCTWCRSASTFHSKRFCSSRRRWSKQSRISQRARTRFCCQYAGHLVSTAICYEIVYPNLVRGFVRGGSELLTTITNDAWFGRTSAPYQHFAQASMRAIEGGRYLVRSANTGISGVVDPYGRVVAESGLFEQTVLFGDARFLRTATVYARIGDAFAYGAVVITLAALLMARRRVE